MSLEESGTWIPRGKWIQTSIIDSGNGYNEDLDNGQKVCLVHQLRDLPGQQSKCNHLPLSVDALNL